MTRLAAAILLAAILAAAFVFLVTFGGHDDREYLSEPWGDV